MPADLAIGDKLTVQGGMKIRAKWRWQESSMIPTASRPVHGPGDRLRHFDTFERLGGTRDYDQVLIRVNGTPAQQLDQDYITASPTRWPTRSKRRGYTVQRVQVPEPGKLALQDIFDALALLLTPFGLLALILSGFLVINTISALMAQQVRQIGVMKAIGAGATRLWACIWARC